MKINETAQNIMEECSLALSEIDEQSVKELLESILISEKIFFLGVGRVMLSLQAICKRFAHLGISAHCVGEITEPAITDKDLLIVASGSGETLFPVAISQKAKKIGATIAWIGSNKESTIATLSDISIRIPVQTKLNLDDELKSMQPMTSLFEQSLLILGDSLAKIIMEEKKIDLHELWQYHANLE